MQLRTNRKKKSTDLDDLGYEEKPMKSHKKTIKPKISPVKDYSLDEVNNNFFYIFKLILFIHKIAFKYFRGK